MQRMKMAATIEGQDRVMATAQQIVKSLNTSKDATEDMILILSSFDNRLSNITSLISAADGDSDARFEAAEKVILGWDSDSLAPEEGAAEYLAAVDVILRLTEDLEIGAGSELMDRAESAIQVAMARLEDEFRHILIRSTVPLDAESLHGSIRRVSLSFASNDGEMEGFESFVVDDHQKAVFQHREDIDSQQGKQIGFSPSQIQQPTGPSVQVVHTGTNSVPRQQMGVQSGQAQQYSGASLNMQQPGSVVPPLQSGTDLVHQQHGMRYQNQLDPARMHNQQPNVAPVNSQIGFEESVPKRGGDDYYLSGSNDRLGMVPQQPKLAAIPMARNHQDMRFAGAPLQNITPGIAGGPNSAPGPALHNIYGHAVGGPPFPSSAVTRPPMNMEPSDCFNLSPVEVYRQKHEVTATGGNVPAPFMTFEASGFPPEILREIHFAGFSSPTPIQAQTWPIALQAP